MTILVTNYDCVTSGNLPSKVCQGNLLNSCSHTGELQETWMLTQCKWTQRGFHRQSQVDYEKCFLYRNVRCNLCYFRRRCLAEIRYWISKNSGTYKLLVKQKTSLATQSCWKSQTGKGMHVLLPAIGMTELVVWPQIFN